MTQIKSGKDRRAGRAVFINRYYAPDFSATAQMLTDVAEGLADLGVEVLVITSAMTYDASKKKLPRKETLNNVNVRRLRTTRFGRSNLLGRSLDYVSFYIVGFWFLLRKLKSSDTLIIKTDPPLLSLPAGFAARLKSARTINWLQDIFPETAGELGVGIARKWPGRWLALFRNRSLRRAFKNVVIGQRMEARLRGFDIPENAISLIPNFCDDTAITPLAYDKNPLRAEWGFHPTDFVIGYSGNLGRAHDVSTILRAAQALKDDPSYKFLFVGGGHLRAELNQISATLGLENIITKPYQPRDQLRQSLAVPNVHWAALKPSLEGLILPSKLYGIAAAGRPLLMIGDPMGDIGRLADEHSFGTTVPIGAVETLIAKLESWRSMPEQCRQMGDNARAFIDLHASRALAVEAWHKLLNSEEPHQHI